MHAVSLEEEEDIINFVQMIKLMTKSLHLLYVLMQHAYYYVSCSYYYAIGSMSTLFNLKFVGPLCYNKMIKNCAVHFELIFQLWDTATRNEVRRFVFSGPLTPRGVALRDYSLTKK